MIGSFGADFFVEAAIFWVDPGDGNGDSRRRGDFGIFCSLLLVDRMF